MKRLKIALAIQAAFCLPMGTSWAGELRSELEFLRDTHPMIRANQHAVNASSARRHAAMAGFLPKLTVTGDSGPEDIVTTPFKTTEAGEPASSDPGDAVSTNLDRKKLSLSVEQNLFNGGKTLIEVSIAGLDRSIKESEYQATSQDVLLEALIAYLQVLRNRLLIRLADLNEKTTLEQLAMETSRVQRGGGVVVDELQAATRLQIVRERRVFYEQGMRDAITTYEQVFGRAPDLEKVQDLETYLAMMPSSVEMALNKGMLSNPRLRQIQFQIDRANKMILMEGSGFLPKVDFVLSKSRDDRVSGIYKKSEDSALLKFSWNLFSGGDSINRTRAAVSEMREIGEREVSTQRKTAELVRMSWNQYQKGIERLKLLENASETSRRVMEGRKRLRDAGRETVLAVLDSEVEYYGVLANKVNAMIDARLGSYRLLHSIGELEFEALNLNNGAFTLPVRPIDAALKQLGAQPEDTQAEKKETKLVTDASDPVSESTPKSGSEKAINLGDQITSQPVVNSNTGDQSADSSDKAVIELIQLVKQWASAWSGKDFTSYSNFYGDQFKTAQFRSKAAWLKFRKPRILGRSDIAVTVDELEVQLQGKDRAEIRFVQIYESGKFNTRAMKTLLVEPTADGWRIVSETSKPLPKLVPVKAQAPVSEAQPAKVQEIPKAEEPIKAEEPAKAEEAPAVLAPVMPTAEPTPAVDPVLAVNALVERWAAAWSSKDFETYGSLYGDQFKTAQHRTKAAWLKFRKPRILGRSDIVVSLEDMQIRMLKPQVAEAVFVQSYESGAVKTRSLKTLRLIQVGDDWRIVSESVKPLPKLAPPKVEAPVNVSQPIKAEEIQNAEEPVNAQQPQMAVSEPEVVIDHTPEVNQLLQRWSTAWSNKDFDAYANFYSDGFKIPKFRSKKSWLKFREPKVTGNNDVLVTVEDVVVQPSKNGKINVTFVQRYASPTLKIRSVKRMLMENTGEGWKILSERD